MRALGAVFKMGSTVAAFSMLWLGSVGLAQAQRTTAPSAVERGRTTFQQTCAACHGERGNGKGPAASALQPRPADLTTIAKRKGTFQASDIEATIKGTSAVRAHGTQTMMVWGAVFLADANGNQAEADARVSDLVKYLESIQVK